MQDLSHLAAGSLSVTSQHGGNQIWGNNAMTAPGSESGDLPPGSVHPAPGVDLGPEQPVGTPGPRRPVGFNPSAVIWKKVG